MVLLLIDDSILDNDIINDNFFTNNNIIPLNTDIGIIKVPYYYNSKHYYRDLSINITKMTQLKCELCQSQRNFRICSGLVEVKKSNRFYKMCCIV